MWKSILGYALSGTQTNYGIANMNNMYNFIISVMDSLESQEKVEDMVDSMIIHLGSTFFKNFRRYMIDKLPNSKHLKVINRL